LGLTFLQASWKAESAAGVATSVENLRVAAARERKVDVARRNMVNVRVGSLGLASRREKREMRVCALERESRERERERERNRKRENRMVVKL
jgi:hypothetical protein